MINQVQSFFAEYHVYIISKLKKLSPAKKEMSIFNPIPASYFSHCFAAVKSQNDFIFNGFVFNDFDFKRSFRL